MTNLDMRMAAETEMGVVAGEDVGVNALFLVLCPYIYVFIMCCVKSYPN